ncbi:MAG: hypothetical protein AAF664_06580 [Planctomycetota bacterium]
MPASIRRVGLAERRMGDELRSPSVPNDASDLAAGRIADRLHDEVIPRLFAALSFIRADRSEGDSNARTEQVSQWLDESMQISRELMRVGYEGEQPEERTTANRWDEVAKSLIDRLPEGCSIKWDLAKSEIAMPPVYHRLVGRAIAEGVRNACKHDRADECQVFAVNLSQHLEFGVKHIGKLESNDLSNFEANTGGESGLTRLAVIAKDMGISLSLAEDLDDRSTIVLRVSVPRIVPLS